MAASPASVGKRQNSCSKLVCGKRTVHVVDHNFEIRSCFHLGGLKAVFHFNRTVPKRGVFLCLVSFQAELMTLGQKKTLRFGTVRLQWKTGLTRLR